MISLRIYGVYISTLAVALIGLVAIIADQRSWGVHVAEATAGCALLVAFLQFALIERLIKNNPKRLPSDYTPDHLVDYMVYTCVYAAIVSAAISVQVQSSWFTAILVVGIAGAAAMQACYWIGTRRSENNKFVPLDTDFRVVVWVAPLAVGLLLLLQGADQKTLANSIFAIMVFIHFAFMQIRFKQLSTTKPAKPARKFSYKDDPDKTVRAQVRRLRHLHLPH